MKKSLLFALAACLLLCNASAFAKREFYAIQIFYLQNAGQEQKVDRYLQAAYLPALHRMGLQKIGVFKPIGNDTSSNRRVFVLIPFTSLEQFAGIAEKLAKDKAYQQSGSEYINAGYNDPNYGRMETVLLKAFSGMPVSEKPSLKATVADKVYELRSYESATEKIYENKVDMFNRGDEVGLFRRLGFNAVFYAEVLAGSHMPNLMYMISFENLQERDAHWKAFGADPVWKELSAKPEYQHNVSHIDSWLMRAAPYSDL